MKPFYAITITTVVTILTLITPLKAAEQQVEVTFEYPLTLEQQEAVCHKMSNYLEYGCDKAQGSTNRRWVLNIRPALPRSELRRLIELMGAIEEVKTVRAKELLPTTET